MRIIQSFMSKYGKYLASASLSLALITTLGNCRYVANQPEEPKELQEICKLMKR